MDQTTGSPWLELQGPGCVSGNQRSARCFRWWKEEDRGRQSLIAHFRAGTWHVWATSLPPGFVKTKYT